MQKVNLSIPSYDTLSPARGNRKAGGDSPEIQNDPMNPCDTVTIASYNVENMFDDVDNPHKCDEKTPPKSAEEMKAVASTLNKADADIVILEEVENKEMLNTLVDDYMKSSDYPERVLVPGNDPRGINVAVLSRFPVSNMESHKDNSFKVNEGHTYKKKIRFSRDLLETEIKVAPHFTVTVYATHLKSQIGGERADEKRLAEAQEIRRLIEEDMKEYPDKAFVVAGDFNDSPQSKPVQAVIGNGGSALEDPLAPLPMTEQYTYTYKGNQDRLDYILLSPELQKDYVKGSAHVLRTPEAVKGSDHSPIELSIKVPEKKAA
ncbi:MAG: endonuclease/exonuclease/phosphatase family protein [Vulcanimicrobiota bacterium]